MSRLDMIVGRKDKSGKTHWTKIGSAWPSERGGYQIIFDALPIPDSEGRCSALLVEPKPREGGDVSRRDTGGRASDIDDSIPF